MTLTSRDLKYRKDLVLSIAIDQYIKTINPVSSQAVVQEFPSEISSATIRNILGELEQDGYLTHPHTSAGRIPTQDGYRYYVDHLMNDIQLLEEEKQKIKLEYEKERLALEQLIEKTSRQLSNITQYTSIVSVDGWGNKVFCSGTSYVVEYPDFQDIRKIKEILIALEQKEQVLEVINKNLEKKIEIYIGHEAMFGQIEDCSLAISSFKSRHGPSGRMAILGPTRMNYERVVSALRYFSDLMEEML